MAPSHPQVLVPGSAREGDRPQEDQSVQAWGKPLC